MPRPDKQIFYEISFKDINKETYSEVIDICCGKMNLYKKIKNVKNYTGIDFDKNMVNIGLSRYPEVQGIVERFENFEPKIKYDLAICFEAIGINNDFENDKVLDFLNKIKNTISNEGYLAINFGPLVLSNFKNEILGHIKQNYIIINSFSYGRWYKKYNNFNYKILYYLIKLFPFISKSKKNEYFYFFLKKK